jgi:ATP:ADP antiporter, AAA family
MIAIAMSGATFTMAYQVAGKAARDALFLSNFRSHHLPMMIVAAALTAIVLGIVSSRLLSHYAPDRIVPAMTIASGALQLVEWSTYGAMPRGTAVAVYLHVISLGAVINSGFWSVINEQLDPYTARRNFGRIASMGTAGGVAGGLAAERVAALTDSHDILLFMAAAQLITGTLLFFLPRREASNAPMERVRASDVLRASKYMRNLSYLVVLGTFSAALLDYVLKSQARNTLGPGEPLLRFFAIFHMGTALLAFVVQTAATPMFLNRFGVGNTVATLPVSVAGAGIFAFFTGGFSAIVGARALEAIVRGSLFRAGYELFYAPMLPAEKRAVKSINDVTVDRLGDGLGGGFAQLVILYAGAASNRLMLLTAAATSAFSWTMARRLQRGYVKSLERGLEHRAEELDIDDPDEVPRLPAPTTRARALDTQHLPEPPKVPPPEWMPQSLRRQWEEILSNDRERIRTALTNGPMLDRALLPHVIPLLGRKSVSDTARQALEAVADRNVGQLSDYLLDRRTPLPVRCKLPGIVASAGGERASDALLAGLCDERQEVRLACGRALDTMRQENGIKVDKERVFDAIRRELDQTAELHGKDVEYIFSLLGVVLPREPVRVAFEALDIDDPQLRGLALEYIESALPPDIRTTLIDRIHGVPAEEQPRRAEGEIREEFVSVLDEIKRVLGDRGGTPPSAAA